MQVPTRALVKQQANYCRLNCGPHLPDLVVNELSGMEVERMTREQWQSAFDPAAGKRLLLVATAEVGCCVCLFCVLAYRSVGIVPGVDSHSPLGGGGRGGRQSAHVAFSSMSCLHGLSSLFFILCA